MTVPVSNSSRLPRAVGLRSVDRDGPKLVSLRKCGTRASLVRPSSGPPRFPPLKVSPRQIGWKDGKPSVTFSAKEIAVGAKRFEHSLVAKFPGGRPPISEIQKAFQACWNVEGKATVSAIWDPRHVFIVLDSEADAASILACPLRSIGQFRFRLFRWSVDFNPRTDPKMTTAWVKFPDLPLPLYDKGFVEVIVSTFGRLLDVDDCSKACRDLSQMRACVEVDASIPIPKEIWVDLPDNKGLWQAVKMETSIAYCSGCKKQGHLVEECRKAIHNREKRKVQDFDTEISNPVAAPIIEQMPNKDRDVHIQSENDGWVLVPHRKAARRGASYSALRASSTSFQVPVSVSSFFERRSPSQAGQAFPPVLKDKVKAFASVPSMDPNGSAVHSSSDRMGEEFQEHGDVRMEGLKSKAGKDSIQKRRNKKNSLVCSKASCIEAPEEVVDSPPLPVTVKDAPKSDKALESVEALKGRAERMVSKEVFSCARRCSIGPGKEQTQRDSSDSDDWSDSDESEEEERSSILCGKTIKSVQMIERGEPKKKEAIKSQMEVRKDKLEALKRTYIKALERTRGSSSSKSDVKALYEDIRKLKQSVK